MNNLRTPPVPAKTFPHFFHGAFAPSFIWRRRPWLTDVDPPRVETAIGGDHADPVAIPWEQKYKISPLLGYRCSEVRLSVGHGLSEKRAI